MNCPAPLTYEDTGKRDGALMVFVHGWPDTGALWREQVEFFSTKYRCIAVTLPGYATPAPYIGYDFPDLVAKLAALITHLKVESSSSEVIVVGHDWGAYLTYLLDQTHPQLATRLITMDVGAHFQPASFAHAAFMLSYQWWLVASFLVGAILRPVGNLMSQLFSIAAKAPRGWNVESRMNYLYFYMWRGIFVKKYRAKHLQRYQITKPLLYLYGKRKKFHFHSQRWEQIVAAAPGSQVIGMEGCDHWLMLRAPAETNARMERWLKDL